MAKAISMKKWFKAPLWQKIMVALILGIISGFIFKDNILVIQPIGTIFINAIHMIIVPVVFFSIINAFISIGDLGSMRSIALKGIVVYAICMLIAASLGVMVTSFFMPGKDLHLVANTATQSSAASQYVIHWSQFLVNMIPANPFQAFSSGNVVQILVFAIILGIAIKMSQEKAKTVVEFCKGGAQVSMQLALLVMKFAPYGIFSLIACAVGQYGLGALESLMKFVGCVYLGCFLMWIFYGVGVYFFAGISPLKFFKQILSPLLMAFTTSSSGATLPVTINCAEEQLKIDPIYTRFLLPLGTNLNLNGLSLYVSAAAVFAANMYGISLGLTQYISIVLMVVVTAMGASATPGSALIIMGAIQSSVGIPLGALPLIAGVDRFNDMMQTSTNVAGDLFAALVVSKLERNKSAAEEISTSFLANE